MERIVQKSLRAAIPALVIIGFITAPASATYTVPDDWETLRPILRMLDAHGVEFDGSAADLARLLDRLSRRAGIAAYEAEKTGFDKLFILPTETSDTEEIDETDVAGDSSLTPGVETSVDFTTRLFWFQPMEYSRPSPSREYELKRIPIRQDLSFRTNAVNYIDTPEEAKEKAASYIRSGEYEGTIDRELSKRVLAEIKYEENIIEYEREAGLIRDFELPYDSELKFEGRKLFTMGYSRTEYDNESTGGAGDGNDINMEGELQLRIEGTIMRKTHVNVDYDDTRENENRNKISVIYKGDPDELVQEAAFGDIILSLPGTEFVSYSSSRSVFGAKVDLKYKWARLMVIASREKGKAEQTTFTGGNEITISEIDDIDYEKRKYYRLNAGRDPTTTIDFFEYSDNKIDTDINGYPKVALYIYRPSKNIGDIPPNKRANITAYEYEDNYVFTHYDEIPKEPEYSKQHDVWERLDQTIDYDINVETGIITMQTNVTEEDSLAVAYGVDMGGQSYTVGYNGANPDFETMKLIKESGNGGQVQRYELKNRYYLGSTSIVNNTLIVKMRDSTRSEKLGDKTYLNIFGLDRDDVGDSGHDQIDSAFIDYSFGLLIVPDDYRSGDSYYHRDRTDPSTGAPDLYNDFLPFDYRKNADDDQYNENSGDGVVEDFNDNFDAYSPGVLQNKYTFYVEFQAARPSFMLRPNIVPGSENVTLDGVRLYINRDYWIDYDSGFIEFLNEEVNDPDKVLQITYEYKPFFELSTKSLVGSRFEFGPDEYNYIGCTFLGEYSEKPRGEDKPDLGGEPANSHVFDADFKIELYPEFMTTMADVLPLVHTNEKSKLQFEGEIARSFRNPNILGVAKVEDFESAKQETSFPVRTAAWRHSSAPAARAEIDQVNRTILKWNNVTVFKEDIDSDWTTDQTDLLHFTNLPTDPVSSSEIYPDTWGSIVRPLSAVGADFIDQRFDTLKITLNLDNLNTDNSDDVEGGLLHIDLGEVSEDADEDGNLDSEDGITGLERDGELQSGEDIGWVFDNTSAGGDDWQTDEGLLRFVPGNTLLDEEDLNNNDELDTNESYFTYEIDLAQVIGGTSPYVTRRGGEGTLQEGWYVLEIPLNLDTGLADTWNNPDPTRIKHFRMWFEATDETDFPASSAINFYSLYLSSVRWEPPILDPDKGLNEVEISTKDSESNGSNEYTPHGQITNEEGDKQREQALVMNYVFNDWDDVGVTEDVYNEYGDFIGVKVYGANNGVFDTEDANHNGILDIDLGEDSGLGPDGIGEGNRRLDQEPPIIAYTAMSNYTPDDYTDYHQMEIWVHNFKPRTDEQDYFFLRFGADEENYFEYRAQLPSHGGSTTDWRPYRINLDFFEKLRQKTVSLLEEEGYISEFGHYFIKGSPSLLDIQKVIVGVGTNNPEDFGSGGFIESREVWFNDILLEDVDKTVGLAKRGEGELDFGGFVMLGGSAKRIDADFNSVGTISTSGRENTTKALNGTLEFAKLMPDSWGIRLPLSGSWSNSETISEIKYDPDQSIYTQGRVESTTKSAKISFDKYKVPSLDLGYKNSYSTNDTYNRISDADTYSASMNYNVFPQTNYLPRNINASFTRKLDRVDYAESDDSVDHDRNWRTDTFRGHIKFEPADDLAIEPGYNYNITVDQIDETEENFAESYSISTRYDRIRGLRPNASYTSSYSEIIVEDYGGSGTGGLVGDGVGILPVSKGKGEKLNLGLTTNFTTSCPIDMGKLSNDKTIGINKLSISPSYSLVRGSSYNNENDRPGMAYRLGRDHLLPDSDNLSTSRIRHTASVNNRFNPLEFLGYRVGTNWEEWDFIQTDFDASYTWEESNTTGTPSRTRTLTFPDITNKLSGVKNFPVFARMMKRSTVTVSYVRKRTLRKFESITIKHSPSVSWRATWKAGSLRTRADFGYDYTVFEYLRTDQGDTLPEKETSISPSFTVNYDWAMPKGFKIPLLGTLRWRNELNLEGSVGLTQSRYENTAMDNSDRWDYSISGGYYLTTSLHLDITGRYTTFANLSTVGADYNTISIFGNLEIIF